MAILKVAQMGHPCLRIPSRDVTLEEIQSTEFQVLCDDMLETMDEYDGTGLAAPQVHVNLRIVVLTLDDERDPEFLINPVITVKTDELTSEMEGCLSVEGMRGRVFRPNEIEVRALDRDGTKKGYELEGFPAVVVQHECDHLDGILYIDKVDTRTLAFKREYDRFGPVDEFLQEMLADDETGEHTTDSEE